MAKAKLLFQVPLCLCILFLSPNTFAVRKVSLPLIRASSDTPIQQSMSTAGSGTIYLALKNLSSSKQTIKVTVNREKFKMNFCADTSAPAGWTKNPGSCSIYYELLPSSRSFNVVLEPYESKEVATYINCAFRSSPSVECGVEIASQCGKTAAPQLIATFTGTYYSGVEYQSQIDIEVKEDRGAVLGSVKYTARNCANGTENNPDSAFINGGRPF